jgi:hypothetical protein
MMRQHSCPKCSLRVDYIAEQVGSMHTCGRCGHQFELAENPFRLMMYLGWATVMGAVSFVAWMAVRVAIRLAGRTPGPRRQ